MALVPDQGAVEQLVAAGLHPSLHDRVQARLTQARQLAGRTKKEVADAIGVTPAAVGQYEAGTRPRPELIRLIADYLGVVGAENPIQGCDLQVRGRLKAA